MVEMEVERGPRRLASTPEWWILASVIAIGREPATGKVGSASSQHGDPGHDVSILIAMVGVDGR